MTAIPKVLGKILGLKNLERAPGILGKFNRRVVVLPAIPGVCSFVETVHGAPQQWYVNARSDLVPWPESLVVEKFEFLAL
ncbi:hypothetical protein C8J57DRAFT_1729936 [Mycena rebaudengoi]|nr:hypothetical protein C8J57DRAFT_1729936 [Mycena rebaudengoi]